jgi:hypothetical protein
LWRVNNALICRPIPRHQLSGIAREIERAVIAFIKTLLAGEGSRICRDGRGAGIRSTSLAFAAPLKLAIHRPRVWPQSINLKQHLQKQSDLRLSAIIPAVLCIAKTAKRHLDPGILPG